MIALEPPLTRSGAVGWSPIRQGTALAVGPRYARTNGMSRWHRVRSGVHRDGGNIWTLWCGQSASDHNRKTGGTLTTETVEDGLPICGTCQGRAIGAGQDTWPGADLVFSPRRLTPPKHCPGSRRNFYVQVGTTAGRCLICGAIEATRAMGGPYNGRYAIVQHPPAEGLIPGCPFHAWTSLTIHDGAAVCACTLTTRDEAQ